MTDNQQGAPRAWADILQQGLRCHDPFTALHIRSTGKATGCMCVANRRPAFRPDGDTTQSDISTIWHGETLNDIRRAFLKGDYEKVCFPHCFRLQENSQHTLGEEDTNALLDILDDPAAAREALPITLLYHDIDRGCNLACVMCRTEKWTADPAKVETSVNQMRELVTNGKLRWLYTSGDGEPFSYRAFIRFLEEDLLQQHKVALSINTNLTFFTPDLWERVKHNWFRRITVSADGASPEVFNTVRLGADWAQVSQNMRFLGTLRRSRQIQHITWNYCILEETLPDIGTAIRLSRAIGFDTISFLDHKGRLATARPNMFETCRLDLLERAHDTLAEAGAFDDPKVILTGTQMLRDHAYREFSYRASMAVLNAEKYADYDTAATILRAAVQDIEVGTIEPPSAPVPGLATLWTRLHRDGLLSAMPDTLTAI